MIRTLFAALAVLAATLVVGFGQPPQASACSLAPLDLENVADIAEIVIVGEVTAERIIEPTSPTYESTVRPAAVLKGAPPGEIVISPLGYLGADCSGGPRLAAGERVLLFVGRGMVGGQAQGELQVVGYEAGKYALHDGLAMQPYTGSSMPADQAIRQVATITGASEDQVVAAIAFAQGDPTAEPPAQAEPVTRPSEDGNGDVALLAIGLASAGALALVLFGVAVWRRLGRAG